LDALISPSDLALYSKLLGGECLIHVDTEGIVTREELLRVLSLIEKASV
jgi:hypothetical protein